MEASFNRSLWGETEVQPTSRSGSKPASSGQSRSRQSAVLLLALWLTLVLLVIKLWLGVATRSSSLLAEALQTVIQSFGLVLSLFSLRFHTPTGRDAAGHGKREVALAGLLVAGLGTAASGLVAYVLMPWLTQTVAIPTTQMNPFLWSWLAGLVAASLGLTALERLLAIGLKNSALQFAAQRSLQDSGGLVLVLLGLVGVGAGATWLEPVLTLGLLGWAAVSSWQLLNRQLPLLVQPMAIAPEALAQTIHQVEGITHCYGLRSRGLVGRQVWVEMRLILHPECQEVARALAERVERAIRERYGPARVVIYIDSDELEE